jgi:TPR repeat protein
MNWLLRIAAMAVLIWPTFSLAADSYEDGLAAWMKGDFDAAHRILLPLANGDGPSANYARDLLGRMFLDGSGVHRNAREAARWFRLAAENGHVQSLFDLAELYRKGLGVAQNYREAIHWYVEATQLYRGTVMRQAAVPVTLPI